MRQRHRGLRPYLEAIEPRALLSVGIVGPAAAGGTNMPVPAHFLRLNGTFRRHYTASSPIPDVGTTYYPGGSGRVSGVGRAFVTGNLHSIGFIAEGQAQGDLFLSGSRGTITVHLTGGEQQGGPKGLPDVFSFNVTGGTGKYSNIEDTGTAVYVGMPGKTSAGAHATEHGKFVLVLTSNPNPPITTPLA
jgi:hypothetical protein